jgi:hypothetical protein
MFSFAAVTIERYKVNEGVSAGILCHFLVALTDINSPHFIIYLRRLFRTLIPEDPTSVCWHESLYSDYCLILTPLSTNSIEFSSETFSSANTAVRENVGLNQTWEQRISPN